jgi:hypothetical protein
VYFTALSQPHGTASRTGDSHTNVASRFDHRPDHAAVAVTGPHVTRTPAPEGMRTRRLLGRVLRRAGRGPQGALIALALFLSAL